AIPNDAAHTLSLHDALPISCAIIFLVLEGAHGAALYNEIKIGKTLERLLALIGRERHPAIGRRLAFANDADLTVVGGHFVEWPRSEEHTSELQSRENLVFRL